MERESRWTDRSSIDLIDGTSDFQSVALRSLVACDLLSYTTGYALSELGVSQSTIE